MAWPNYVYVASSWRNPMQEAVCHVLKAAKISHYDFKNPEGGTGFAWKQVKFEDGPESIHPVAAKGSDWEEVQEYLRMLAHPRAEEGFWADYHAMMKADAFVMVLPCGKSAHLELGWALGHGTPAAILLENPVEPELMYKIVEHSPVGKLCTSVMELLEWLGVED